MNMSKQAALSFIFAFLMMGAVQADEVPLKGMKLGIGIDRGFGLTGSLGDLNGFLGDKGIAVDYVFRKGPLEIEVNAPVTWYIAGGGYGDWDDGDLGVRLPVGVQLPFDKRLDGYAHVIPRLRINHGNDFGVDFGIGVRYAF